MAVVKVHTLHNEWTGTIKGKAEETEFSCSYVIEVNDANDGPETVTEHDDLPQLGDLYELGNDGDVPHKVTEKSFSRIDDKHLKCVVKWSIPKPKKKKNPAEQDSSTHNNPLLEPPGIELREMKQEEAAVFGTYIGQYDVYPTGSNSNPLRAGWGHGGSPDAKTHAEPSTDLTVRGGIKNATAIINSAGAPFDPPLTRDRSLLAVIIKRNVQYYPWHHMDWVQTVNKDSWTLDHPWRNLIKTFWPFSCYMFSITGQFTYETVGNVTFKYWQMSYEFHVDELYGWRRDVLDYGYDQSGGKHVPGAGSYSDFQQNNVPPPAGQVPILSATGMQPKDPVKLDGGGSALTPHSGPDAVYLKWAIYPEIDYGNAISTFFNHYSGANADDV